MRNAARAGAVVVAALALTPGCAQTGGQTPEPAPGAPRIRLASSPAGQRTVDVAGLAAVDLAHLERAALSRDEWQAILRVHVAQPIRRPRSCRRSSATTPCTRARCASPRGSPSMRVNATRWCSNPSPLPSARGGSAAAPPRACARRSTCRLPTASRRPVSSLSIRRAPRCPRTTSACTSSSRRRWGCARAVCTSGCSTSTASRSPTRFCRSTSTSGTRTARASPSSTTPGASSAASGRTPSSAARWREAAGTPS